jgi:hypothetical protein
VKTLNWTKRTRRACVMKRVHSMNKRIKNCFCWYFYVGHHALFVGHLALFLLDILHFSASRKSAHDTMPSRVATHPAPSPHHPDRCGLGSCAGFETGMRVVWCTRIAQQIPNEAEYIESIELSICTWRAREMKELNKAHLPSAWNFINLGISRLFRFIIKHMQGVIQRSRWVCSVKPAQTKNTRMSTFKGTVRGKKFVQEQFPLCPWLLCYLLFNFFPTNLLMYIYENCQWRRWDNELSASNTIFFKH